MGMEAEAGPAEVDVFVASRIGSFKHVKYHTDQSKNSKKQIANLQDISALQKDDRITCMRWSNLEQTEILIGRASREVQTYSTELGVFVNSVVAEYGTGHIVGLGRSGRHLISALSSGSVQLHSKKKAKVVDIVTGKELDCMKMCPDDKRLLVTGGKENEVKVWSLESPAGPAFTAKNIPHDFLQLRAPVWPTDVCFLPGSGGVLIAACSRYSTVRLYDTRVQRRPVCDVFFEKMAATCITPSFDERQVLVGFGRGQLHQVDLRNKGRPDKGYKGCVGAVTDVSLVPGTPYIVSASLDRHLRVHHRDTKKMLYKQYLTSKLTCVLVQTDSTTPLRRSDKQVKTEDEESDGGEDRPVDEHSGDDLDDIFENMETVSETSAKKRKSQQKSAKKKVKVQIPDAPEVEELPDLPDDANLSDDDADLPDEDVDDRIARLLRLTEKKKRRLEREKRERKKKSLYHNA